MYMDKELSSIIGRTEGLFDYDIGKYEDLVTEIISKSSFLIIGGAGSIGSAVTYEIFKRKPKTLHVVDISENSNVELVRNIRSSLGYIDGDFKVYSIDYSSVEFQSLVLNNKTYDYVFNLSALKHVRSEADPFTLMRMTKVNIIHCINSLKITKKKGSKNFFNVSSDKATDPINMMGASKKIAEIFLQNESLDHNISSARFANVAFSNGSLLQGFEKRLSLKQPLTAPINIKRYFITPKESAELCLLSALLGKNREIYFPKLDLKKDQVSFTSIVENFLKVYNFEIFLCEDEIEARSKCKDLIKKNLWPCYFFKSDTTGEKIIEEFFHKDEITFMNKYNKIGIIENNNFIDSEILNNFIKELDSLLNKRKWDKSDILNLYFSIIPDFKHEEKNKYLNERM